jgi:hypothetical protein
MNDDDLLEIILADEDETFDSGPLFSLIEDEIALVNSNKMKEFIKAVIGRSSILWFMPVAPDDKDDLQNLWPKDCYKPGGELLNIRRIVRTCDVLAESHQIETIDRDILLAAAFIHSITKYYSDEDGDAHYDPMHPYTVDTYLGALREEEQTTATEGMPHTIHVNDDTVLQILRIVRCQRGPWSTIPETVPSTLLEILLHTACQFMLNVDYIIDGDEIVGERWEF